MENKNIKQLPNGKWEYLVDEDSEMIVVADSLEEAERMAAEYFKGDKSVAKKRIARQDIEKTRTAVLDTDD